VSADFVAASTIRGHDLTLIVRFTPRSIGLYYEFSHLLYFSKFNKPIQAVLSHDPYRFPLRIRFRSWCRRIPIYHSFFSLLRLLQSLPRYATIPLLPRSHGLYARPRPCVWGVTKSDSTYVLPTNGDIIGQ
jgi:hypothetical protein